MLVSFKWQSKRAERMAVMRPYGNSRKKFSSLGTDNNVGPDPERIAFAPEKRGKAQTHAATSYASPPNYDLPVSPKFVLIPPMKMFSGWMAAALFGVCLVQAHAIDKVMISSFKRPGDVTKVNGGNAYNGVAAKNEETVHYELRLQNQTIGDLSGLKVDYIIFVQRQKLGERMTDPPKIERIAGSQPVDVLNNRDPKSVMTTAFALHKQTLGGGWSYTNGGRVRAEDSVGGVWVRISQGDQMIAEYINPSSVKSRGWDGK